METYISSSHEELQTDFWLTFSSLIETLESEKPIYIGLSGGISCDIFYAVIMRKLHLLPLELRTRLRFAPLDERIVPMGHADSNMGQLRAKFLDQLVKEKVIAPSQILEVDQIGVSDIPFHHSQKVPYIDIALFGVGPDGHIASLFPHHPLLQSTNIGYLEILDSPKPPPHRITVSPVIITKMKYVFLSFPKEKEGVYEKFRDRGVSSEELPVKLLLENEQLFVFHHRRGGEDLI